MTAPDVLAELFRLLPPAGAPWPTADRGRWAQALAACIDLVYPDTELPAGTVSPDGWELDPDALAGLAEHAGVVAERTREDLRHADEVMARADATVARAREVVRLPATSGYTCPHCPDRTFPSHQALSTHLRAAHADPVRCDWCGNSYNAAGIGPHRKRCPKRPDEASMAAVQARRRAAAADAI